MLTSISNYFDNLVVNPSPSRLLTILATFGIIIAAALLLRRILLLYYLYKREVVYLELTPGLSTSKTPDATEQLFSVLHDLDGKRSWLDMLLGRRNVLSLEIISSKKQGIRFLACVDVDKRAAFEKIVNSYVPEVHLRVLSEIFPTELLDRSKVRLLNFKQQGHFAYPLKPHQNLEQHDPIAYLTASMTKLSADELMIFQLVFSPVSTRTNKRFTKKFNSIRPSNKALRRGGTFTSLLRSILALFLMLVKFLLTASVSSILGRQSRNRPSGAYVNTYSQSELFRFNSAQQKLEQPLYYTSIRALIVNRDKSLARQRIQGLRSSLASFKVPGQSLNVRRRLLGAFTPKLDVFLLRNHLPSLIKSRSAILSTSEIAALYHFPYNETVRTENVVKSLTRSLEAPVSLKAKSQLDVIMGVNSYHGERTAIGLTEHEREQHVYIVGGTGNGKTTMLLGSIVQDMQNGKGIAVIDPHGDLAESILRYVPESRLDDVVYFNPDDLDYPMGLNLLEIPSGLSDTELLRERDLVGESVISIFRKLFSGDDSGGHRVEYILRNAIQTALTLPDATLFTIYELLNDPTYQKTIVRGLTDKNLRNFWWHEFGRAGDYQKVKMAAGVTAKIGRFLFSASARQILEQPRSTIDFDDILASGKILICNVSKGRLGEDTSTLFGTTVLAKLQIATLRRARTVSNERRPFYVYVDEFQNFATTAFVQMLSEARKYKLFLTMAEQSTSQQEHQRNVQVILANVGTLVCFRTGNPADEQLLLPAFKPFLGPGELANLPAYNFYVRLSALRPHEPLSGETQPLPTNGSDDVFNQVIAISRELYVVPRPTTRPAEDLPQEGQALPVPVKSKPPTVYPVPLTE